MNTFNLLTYKQQQDTVAKTAAAVIRVFNCDTEGWEMSVNQYAYNCWFAAKAIGFADFVGNPGNPGMGVLIMDHVNNHVTQEPHRSAALAWAEALITFDQTRALTDAATLPDVGIPAAVWQYARAVADTIKP